MMTLVMNQEDSFLSFLVLVHHLHLPLLFSPSSLVLLFSLVLLSSLAPPF